MTYDKKIDYLEYWMKENKSLSNNEFVDKICRQLEILDMAKYIGNNNYNEPKLILYTGLVPSNQKEVFTILTNYEGKSKDYILATETELNKFISVDFYDISLRIGYYCPLEVQERINDFVFSKAVERHAEGNVPAIIMNVGNGFGEVWLKDELPALIESDAVTMVDGIDMHLLRNMDKSSISKCIEAVSHVAYDNINKANVNSLLNNVSKLKETSYYGLSERVIDHNHNGELDYNEAVALYSTKRDCELLINWGYGFVKRFSNDIYMEYLEKVPNTSNAASYHSTNNLHMYIDQNSKYVTFTDPGKNSPPHEQWNYQSNSEIFQEDPWPCPHPDQPDDDEVHNENHDEHENSSNKNKSLGKKLQKQQLWDWVLF